MIPTIAGHLQYASLMHEFQEEKVLPTFAASEPMPRRKSSGGAISKGACQNNVVLSGTDAKVLLLLKAARKLAQWQVGRSFQGQPASILDSFVFNSNTSLRRK